MDSYRLARISAGNHNRFSGKMNAGYPKEVAWAGFLLPPHVTEIGLGPVGLITDRGLVWAPNAKQHCWRVRAGLGRRVAPRNATRFPGCVGPAAAESRIARAASIGFSLRPHREISPSPIRPSLLPGRRCQHARDGCPNYSAMPRRHCRRVLRFQSAVRREQEVLCAPEMKIANDRQESV